MKPLLRAVLIIDAVLLLAFGVLFVLTPGVALQRAAACERPAGDARPGVRHRVARRVARVSCSVQRGSHGAGRAFGRPCVLADRRADDRLVDRYRQRSALAAAGRVLSAVAGVALIVLGLGGVRLASAVRRRERNRRSRRGSRRSRRARLRSVRPSRRWRPRRHLHRSVSNPSSAAPQRPLHRRHRPHPAHRRPAPSHSTSARRCRIDRPCVARAAFRPTPLSMLLTQRMMKMMRCFSYSLHPVRSHARQNPDSRLRFASHPTDCATRARSARLLRNPSERCPTTSSASSRRRR